MHARRAAERIDAEPRIVGERRQAGGAARVARLGERVLQEGTVRFIRLVYTELRLRHDFDGKRREQRADLADFSRVAGGEDDAFQTWYSASQWYCKAR